MSGVLLRALCDAGHEVDAYLGSSADGVPEHLHTLARLRFHELENSWEFDRWYSRTDVAAHLSGSIVRAYGMLQLGRRIAAAHRTTPYDLIYQFSTPELIALRGAGVGNLPPIVLHPEVHAAGELRWHGRERRLAMEVESLAQFASTNLVLRLRAQVQRRDLGAAWRVICPSAAFASHVVADAGIPASNVRVVPNPIDLERFTPGGPAFRRPDGRREIVFVSRLAVRKGVEQVVGLSHRLSDLSGEVAITVVGERSLWSDYRHLLHHGNPGVLEWAGELEPSELVPRMRGAAMVIQPSKYEPFALAVGEALACGTPVVVSTEVGASEGVHGEVARLHDPGDLNGLEAQVRTLVAELRSGDRRAALATLARDEAERLYAVREVGRRLTVALTE